MRIIAGRFRSRLLKSVPGLAVRPTPDRLREAMFNVLTGRVEGRSFLDAYAGSGAVGLEALSRGARHVILIEKSPAALSVMRENVESLQVQAEVTILRGSAARHLESHTADIAFVDPPYEHVAQYDASLQALSKTGCELAVAQHPSRLTLEKSYGHFKRQRILRQGDNSLSFYGKTDSSSASE
ncbi:MAG: 16S rRNA (guanine(966)-N(2))-methyltransferase RsmD [Bryobacteraceae bacterium]